MPVSIYKSYGVHTKQNQFWEKPRAVLWANSWMQEQDKSSENCICWKPAFLDRWKRNLPVAGPWRGKKRLHQYACSGFQEQDLNSFHLDGCVHSPRHHSKDQPEGRAQHGTMPGLGLSGTKNAKQRSGTAPEVAGMVKTHDRVCWYPPTPSFRPRLGKGSEENLYLHT